LDVIGDGHYQASYDELTYTIQFTFQTA
jgi:hypothetical protein